MFSEERENAQNKKTKQRRERAREQVPVGSLDDRRLHDMQIGDRRALGSKALDRKHRIESIGSAQGGSAHRPTRRPFTPKALWSTPTGLLGIAYRFLPLLCRHSFVSAICLFSLSLERSDQNVKKSENQTNHRRHQVALIFLITFTSVISPGYMICTIFGRFRETDSAIFSESLNIKEFSKILTINGRYDGVLSPEVNQKLGNVRNPSFRRPKCQIPSMFVT